MTELSIIEQEFGKGFVFASMKPEWITANIGKDIHSLVVRVVVLHQSDANVLDDLTRYKEPERL